MASIKNIEKSTVLTLKDEVAYQAGQVVSKTLGQNSAHSVTLFAFDKGEDISTHESDGDAFVTCLDGVGELTIDGVKYELHEGQSIVMPAHHPHAVYGKERYKIQLGGIFCYPGKDTTPLCARMHGGVLFCGEKFKKNRRVIL